jgi:hypothetical protein
MRKENKKFFITFSEEENEKVICAPRLCHNIIKTLNNNKVFTFEAVKDLENEKPDPYSSKFRMEQVLSRVAPQISAAISSYVRMDLALLLYRDRERTIAYVDTDSAFVEGDKFPFEPDPTKPGAWKKETDFVKAYIFAPKFYYLILEENDLKPNSVLFKASGLNENYKKEIHFEDLLKFLTKDGQSIHIEGDINKGKSTLQADKFTFLMQVKPRSTTIHSTSIENNCCKVYDKDGIWFKTEPLVFINGVPSNIYKYTPIYIKQKIAFENYQEEMSKQLYFSIIRDIRKYQKEQEKMNAFMADPSNLPGSSKIDKFSGYFRNKTDEEAPPTCFI